MVPAGIKPAIVDCLVAEVLTCVVYMVGNTCCNPVQLSLLL